MPSVVDRYENVLLRNFQGGVSAPVTINWEFTGIMWDQVGSLGVGGTATGTDG